MALARRSGSKQLEPFLGEVGIERERRLHAVPAHELEADVVDEAHRTAAGGAEGRPGERVELGIDPADVEQVQQIFVETAAPTPARVCRSAVHSTTT